MIGKDQIAEVVRNTDAISEEHEDIPGFCRERDVDIEGLAYVAEQRGLRAVMMIKGMSPNVQHATSVYLAPDEERLQALFASMFLSAFMAGVETQRLHGASA